MPNEVEKQDWLHDLREMCCSDASAQQIMEALDASDQVLATELLRMEKQSLLQKMHEAENRVDLADFLIYKLRRKE